MKVRGTMDTVKAIDVNLDTVYIRSNVVQIDTEDFKGWEYDEIQYTTQEYLELISTENEMLKENEIVISDAVNEIILGGII